VAVPIALALDGTDVALNIGAELFKRTAERRKARLARFLVETDRRLPPEAAEKVPLDLFEEIVATAIADEDNDKVPYYAAIAEFVAMDSPPPYLVRIMANAAKELTVDELKHFGQFSSQLRWDHAAIDDEYREAFFVRIQTHGLYVHAAAISKGNITPLGNKFGEICRAAEKPPPE
jgi:hypothetical protein